MKLKLLLILVFSFFSQYLFSQSQEPVKLFLSNATANIGDTVLVNLTVQNFKNFKTGLFRVSYSREELRYQGFTNKAFNNIRLYDDGNALRIELPDTANAYNLSDNSILITFKMYVYGTARDGTNSIAMNIDYIADNLQTDQLNKETMIGFSGSINTNQKPINKLQAESKIESVHCNSVFTIHILNVNGTANPVFNWQGNRSFDFYDGKHRKDFQERVDLQITDEVLNKLYISYFIGSNLFDGEVPFTAKVDITLENCETPTAKITAMGGKPPYLYQFNAFPPSTSNVFKDFEQGGLHSIYAIDSFGCSAGENLVINIQPLFIDYEFQYNNCSANSGVLKINTQGGTPIYKVYLDGILKGSDSNITLDQVVIGAHIIKVIDSKGCEKQIEIKLEASSLFTVFPFVYGGDCIARNLKIDVFNTTQPFETYRYQLDNNAFQPLPNFLNVPVGTHTITVRDINGCEIKQTVEIKPVSNTYYTKEIIKTDCVNRVFDFKIKPYNGVAPYKIKYTTESGVLINPVDSVFKNVPETYSGHNIEITDAQGCILKTRDTVYARNLIGLDLSWNYEASSCSNKGKLTLILRGGDANRNFQFKLDNGAFSNNLIYENVDAGLHKLFVQAEGFCNEPITLDLKAASAITYKKSLELGCGNVQNILFIIPNGGIAPYKIYLNNVLNPNGEAFFNVEKGIYTVKIEDANGCSFTKKDTLFNVPAFEVKGDTFCRIADSMFLIPKINFTGNRQLSYLWSNGSTNSTLRLFKPQPMIYTVTVTDSGSNGICSKVASFVILPQCVWPGDTDTSGVVNARDLFNIGIAYGETGFKRNSMDIRWYPHISKEWLKYTPNFFNYKHIDTNGDGIINDGDTSAVAQNWGLIHELKSSSIPLANRGAAPFIYIKNEPVIDGSNSLQIILGDGNLIAQNVYGVAFTIDFDENVIDERSVYAAVRGSWLVESNVLSIYKVNAGKIHIALVRKNKIATNGAGNIARIYFNTKKNALLKNIPFSIENQQVINEKGQEIPILSKNTIINSSTPTVDIESDSEIKLYPNPAIDKINIESIDSPLKEIVLTNMMGTVLKTYQIASKIFEIQLSDLPSGTYFLRIKTEKNIQMKYFIKP